MIYFDNNKQAYAFEIEDYIFSCEDSLWQDWQENEKKYIWQNNKIVDNPNYEQEKAREEQEKINLLSLTKREVFLALYKNKNITPEQLRNSITNPAELIEFDYAQKYYRGNPLIESIGTTLGYTKEQLDYLFKHGEFEQV